MKWRIRGKPKVRTLYTYGALAPANRYFVHNNDTNNAYRALSERVFNVVIKDEDGVELLQPPPAPSPLRTFKSRLKLRSFEKSFRRMVRPVAVMTYDQFLDCYSGRKKTIYSNAIETLQYHKVEYRDAWIKLFIKCEKIKSSPEKPDPCPRAIQPRDPRYNVEVGRFLKPLESIIFGMLKSLGQTRKLPMVMKGLNAQDAGGIMKQKWDRFHKPVAFGFDATRFDQHVSPEALRFEHEMYSLFFSGKDRAFLRELLSWQVNNKGSGTFHDGYVKYTRIGSRMSGDMNTSLGNCLIMCAIVYEFCHNRFTKWELANNGDDCVLIVEEDEIPKLDTLKEFLLEHGFTVIIEDPVYILEQVEFCQTHPVWTPQGYRMVRNLEASMAKDSLCFLDLTTEVAARGQLNALGQCGLSLTSGIPVVQEYYTAMIRESHGVLSRVAESVSWKSGMYWLSQGMTAKHCDVHPITRASFYLAFGVTPNMQFALELYYSLWKYTHLILPGRTNFMRYVYSKHLGWDPQVRTPLVQG